MVFIPPPPEPDCYTAYLFANLTDAQLKDFKAAFELGACSSFSPMMELKIVRPPADYVGKSHQYIRAKEYKAGNEDPFVIIDNNFLQRGAVWYIDKPADDDQVEDGEAVSTDVIFKILVKTEALALTWANYDIANMGIGEDLENCGVEMPLRNDFEQPEVSDCGGLDMREELWSHDVWVTAEPGEYDESTDKNLRDNFSPRPDKVARLKESVAKSAGLVNDWTFIDDARDVELPDGTTKKLPKGSIVLQLKYNPEFPRPAYKWPKGSL